MWMVARPRGGAAAGRGGTPRGGPPRPGRGGRPPGAGRAASAFTAVAATSVQATRAAHVAAARRPRRPDASFVRLSRSVGHLHQMDPARQHSGRSGTRTPDLAIATWCRGAGRVRAVSWARTSPRIPPSRARVSDTPWRAGRDHPRSDDGGIETSTPRAGWTVTRSPRALLRWAPIEDKLKKFDGEIVENSVKFSWRDIREQFQKRIDGAAVCADWSRQPTGSTNPA